MAKTNGGGAMAMQTPKNKDQKRILKQAEAAGWTIMPTRQGWRVMSPDGVNMVTMHGSSSDNRALHNIKADFKRAGLEIT